MGFKPVTFPSTVNVMESEVLPKKRFNISSVCYVFSYLQIKKKLVLILLIPPRLGMK